MTKIGQIIKDIQHATDLTVEEIGERIGYSRQWLSKVSANGDSPKVYNLLRDTFAKELQKVEGKPDDSYIKSILNLTESNKLLAAALTEFSKSQKLILEALKKK